MEVDAWVVVVVTVWMVVVVAVAAAVCRVVVAVGCVVDVAKEVEEVVTVWTEVETKSTSIV